MIQLNNKYSNRLVYGLIIHNYLEYLKDKKGDKKDHKRFIANQKRLCLKAIKIKNLKS